MSNASCVRAFVIGLFNDSASAAIHPVDRAFVETKMDLILAIDRQEFIFWNFELLPNLYVKRLFACLPELWSDINLSDLLAMAEKFGNNQAFYNLIVFTYKYVEIDIILPVYRTSNVRRNEEYASFIRSVLELQWHAFNKTESEVEDFYDGFIDVDPDEWLQVKQRMLLDDRVFPAERDNARLETYIQVLLAAMDESDND